jgi:DNA-binding response OmpR family regulator
MATDQTALHAQETLPRRSARAEAGPDLPTVLIVEDEPTTRQTMRLFLKACGYTAIEAETVEGAVEALSNGIRAAVLDVELTGNRSGLEVLGPLRLRPELFDIPVLVLTGGILTDAEEALVKEQRAFVFYKPEGYDTIVSFLDRLTGRVPATIAGATPAEGNTLNALRRHFISEVQRESGLIGRGSTAEFDWARERQILHRWTGVGGTLGFTEISRRALELQTLLDEPGTGATDRLRAGIDEIARLCLALTPAPPESRSPPAAVMNGLAGKTVALVGFRVVEARWMENALRQAQAFARVFDPTESVEGMRAIRSFDLAAINASGETDAAWQPPGDNVDGVAPTDPRVLLIGSTEAVAQRAPAFHDTVHDFLITPCEPEEFLLRASRLLSAAHERSDRSSRTAGDRRVRVIVADDDRTITALVSAAFQNYDFDCDVAFEGGQALDLVGRVHPDVLVLDVNMPQFDGFEVLHTIKNDPATAGIAVVLLSARQQEADIMRGFALGADDYVVKPFSPLELIARVKRLLRKRAA